MSLIGTYWTGDDIVVVRAGNFRNKTQQTGVERNKTW